MKVHGKEESGEEFLWIFEQRGKDSLELARQEVLDELSKIESLKVKEALRYFILDYWQDLARPTLLSVCCEAVGGNPRVVTPFAISLSIISGGIDIHDDIIDGTKKKHGRKTVYGKYGKEIALLTADALIFKGFSLLHEATTKVDLTKAQKIINTIKSLFYELGDAEALELTLRRRWDVTPGEYLRIIEKKAADVEAHARIGAILGNATAKDEKKLARYGRLLGIIIIIRDDILDVLDPHEFRQRLKKEHMPLPLVYALKEKNEKELSNISPDKMVNNFKKDIEKGVEKCDNLLKELVQEASYYIKDLKFYAHLEILLKAMTISNAGSEVR